MQRAAWPCDPGAELEGLRRDIERVRREAAQCRGLREALLVQSAHGIVVRDAQGGVVARNAAAERLLAASAVPEDVLSASAPIVGDDGEVEGTLTILTDVREQMAARRRLEVITAVSAILASSIDHDTTIDQAVSLFVPRFADGCAVDLLDRDGGLRRLVVRHHGRAALDEADPATQRDVRAVIATGAPELTPRTIVVPMRARGRLLGALTLVQSVSERRFDRDDLRLGEDLAQRMALSVDRGQLYRDAEAARAQLFSLFTQAPTPIAITRGPEHVVELANPPYLALMGAARRDILDRVYATGEADQATELSVGDRFFNVIYQPTRGHDGQVDGVMTMAFDVTDQVEARRLLAEETRTLEAVNRVGTSLAAELEPGRLVQTITEAAARLAGAEVAAFLYTAERGGCYEGRHVVRIDDLRTDPRRLDHPPLPLPARPPAQPPVAGYLAVPVISRSGRLIGGLVCVHQRPGVFGERAEKLVVGLAGQAATAMDNASLFREAQDLIAALERSNAELDQFAYVTSHDLKAPLRGIASLAQWLEEDLGPALTDEARGHLRLLAGRVARMQALIDGILDYSRAGRVHGTWEAVDTGKLLADIAELLAPAPPARLEIAPDMPVVECERVPLQQVFMNLISNALKHARRPDVHVRVSVTDAGDRWVFGVHDNGPGIAPEYQERVWGVFQTLEPRDRVEGAGIGLAIVRKLVSSRGGKTWIESEPGKGGASFYVAWPKSVA
jgi:signal transduction histidine kinase